jgi:tetratricopeptide (TPR) repeat protein
LQGIAFELEDYKQALQLTDSSLAYTTSTQHIDLRTIYFDKADILIELLQYDEALKFADSSLHYGNKFANYAYVAENYALLARIYELKGNYKSAYNYYKLEKILLIV